MTEVKNHGWRVTFAGLGINLALGILYTWSIISGQIDAQGWGWTASQRVLPYTVACLVFSLIMIPAGRMQDKYGPRIVASLGGVLVGAGMILASMTQSVTGYVVGFGVLAGAGMGFGYASATPPAVKWFSAAKTGMIAGLVVSGFGLASVYAAPLTTWLAVTWGLKFAMMALGIGFLVVVVTLAQLLVTPPKDFVPEGSKPAPTGADALKKVDFLPSEMLKTWQFYAMWFMYACGSGAGLMVISAATKIVKGAGTGNLTIFGHEFVVYVLAVSSLGVGNGAGRVIAGKVSDKIGRTMTLFMFFVIQALTIFLLSRASAAGSVMATPVILMVLAALVGANYGSNLALFPSMTKDFFGLKNFGMNYGLVFSAWGIGGFLLARFAAAVYDGKYQALAAWKGNYDFAFYTSAVLLLLAGVMTFVVKAPKQKIS